MHVRSEPGPVFGKDSPVARVNAGSRVIGAIQSRLIPSVPFMVFVSPDVAGTTLDTHNRGIVLPQDAPSLASR